MFLKQLYEELRHYDILDQSIDLNEFELSIESINQVSVLRKELQVHGFEVTEPREFIYDLLQSITHLKDNQGRRTERIIYDGSIYFIVIELISFSKYEFDLWGIDDSEIAIHMDHVSDPFGLFRMESSVLNNLSCELPKEFIHKLEKDIVQPSINEMFTSKVVDLISYEKFGEANNILQRGKNILKPDIFNDLLTRINTYADKFTIFGDLKDDIMHLIEDDNFDDCWIKLENKRSQINYQDYDELKALIEFKETEYKSTIDLGDKAERDAIEKELEKIESERRIQEIKEQRERQKIKLDRIEAQERIRAQEEALEIKKEQNEILKENMENSNRQWECKNCGQIIRSGDRPRTNATCPGTLSWRYPGGHSWQEI